MPVLLRIAFRNLWEHRGKTLIIGSLIALGVLILIVGNSMMETATLGIRRAFIENYTGHVFVSGVADGAVSLFGVQSVGGIDPTPQLPEYPRIRDRIAEDERVERYTSQVSGFGLVRIEDERVAGLENSTFSLLFGVDARSYWEIFESIDLVEGRILGPGERGILLTVDRVEELEELMVDALEDQGVEEPEVELGIGDEVRLVSGLQGGLPKIRVVPLVGIYELAEISEGVGAEFVSFVDIDTQRALQGLTLVYQGEFDIDADATALLDLDVTSEALETGDLGDLFDDEVLDVESEPGPADTSQDLSSLLELEESDQTSETDPEESARSERSEGEAERTGGSWHYILATVENSRDADDLIADLNAWFEAEGIPAEAGDWEKAAGPFATTADVIRTVFNVAIIIVGVVAVIIIMNTMVVSVIERTAEIGTMRALGAQRGFVWRMFLYETVTISVVFGVIGIVLALAAIGILNAIGIPATNTFTQVLFAGPELRPNVSMTSVYGSVIIVALIGILSHIYPVAVALKIEPIRAIQTE